MGGSIVMEGTPKSSMFVQYVLFGFNKISNKPFGSIAAIAGKCLWNPLLILVLWFLQVATGRLNLDLINPGLQLRYRHRQHHGVRDAHSADGTRDADGRQRDEGDVTVRARALGLAETGPSGAILHLFM